MLCPLTRRNRYLGSVPFAPHLPEFTAPLATSTSESGLPGVTTPGTFHPSVFETVRRFTPPISCLFYFTQAPPMGFKELADLLSLKIDGFRGTLLRARVSKLGQDRIPAAVHLDLLLSSFFLPSTPLMSATTATRASPDTHCFRRSVAFQRIQSGNKRLPTDSLRQPYLELTRFSHALLFSCVSIAGSATFGRDREEFERVPEGSSSCPNRTPLRRTRPEGCVREKQERTCVQSEDLTRDDRPGKPRVPDCSPPAPTRRAHQVCKHTWQNSSHGHRKKTFVSR